MHVLIDPFVARIADSLDEAILKRSPQFSGLAKFHRLHLLLKCLSRLHIVEGEKFGTRKVKRWQPAFRLRQLYWGWYRRRPYHRWRIEAPTNFSTDFDDYTEYLIVKEKLIEKMALNRAARFSV